MGIILLGIAGGVLLGLTGGGGAIVAVPVLVYGVGLPIKTATTMSLLVVGVSAVIGTLLRRQEVAWRNGVVFAVIGSISAPLGVKAAQIFSESLLIGSFALLMLLIAMITLRKSLQATPVLKSSLPLTGSVAVVKIIPIAMLTGFLTGLFGVGGGFIIVPALVILNKMENKPAVATSLFIISLLSMFSLLNKIAVIEVDFKLAAIFLFGSIIGMLFGSFVAKKITNRLSQQIFAGVAGILGILMLNNSITKLLVVV